jgi:sulfopyruvate decarboxylase subunit beta
MRLTHHEALEILARHRGNRIVITTMTAVGIWPQLSDTPLDFAYIPSAMGHAPGLGLGLALAQPERGVVVVNGDGSMLMNLGCLVTLANHPANVYLLILDNGIYEVTGGQPTAGAGHTDFAALARGAGIRRVYECGTKEEWASGSAEALGGPGPVVVWLHVEGRLGQKTPKPPRPMAEQIARLQAELSVDPLPRQSTTPRGKDRRLTP